MWRSACSEQSRWLQHSPLALSEAVWLPDCHTCLLWPAGTPSALADFHKRPDMAFPNRKHLPATAHYGFMKTDPGEAL